MPRASRMDNDERRAHLVRVGMELLGKRAYDEVSIAMIAAAAGVSKGLLYHYFPTKSDFVVAVLDAANDELEELTAPDPRLGPVEQIDRSLDAFLGFVEDHSAAYAAIFRTRGAGVDDAVQSALEGGRQRRIDAVIAAVADWPGSDPAAMRDSAALRTAVQGWIFFVEGAVLRWLERRDVDRDELRTLLRRVLLAAVGAAEQAPGAQSSGSR